MSYMSVKYFLFSIIINWSKLNNYNPIIGLLLLLSIILLNNSYILYDMNWDGYLFTTGDDQSSTGDNMNNNNSNNSGGGGGGPQKPDNSTSSHINTDNKNKDDENVGQEESNYKLCTSRDEFSKFDKNGNIIYTPLPYDKANYPYHKGYLPCKDK